MAFPFPPRSLHSRCSRGQFPGARSPRRCLRVIVEGGDCSTLGPPQPSGCLLGRSGSDQLGNCPMPTSLNCSPLISGIQTPFKVLSSPASLCPFAVPTHPRWIPISLTPILLALLSTWELQELLLLGCCGACCWWSHGICAWACLWPVAPPELLPEWRPRPFPQRLRLVNFPTGRPSAFVQLVFFAPEVSVNRQQDSVCSYPHTYDRSTHPKIYTVIETCGITNKSEQAVACRFRPKSLFYFWFTFYIFILPFLQGAWGEDLWLPSWALWRKSGIKMSGVKYLLPPLCFFSPFLRGDHGTAHSTVIENTLWSSVFFLPYHFQEVICRIVNIAVLSCNSSVSILCKWDYLFSQCASFGSHQQWISSAICLVPRDLSKPFLPSSYSSALGTEMAWNWKWAVFLTDMWDNSCHFSLFTNCCGKVPPFAWGYMRERTFCSTPEWCS